MTDYDIIILGAGPAGLAAGIYAGRYLLKTLIIGEMNGGTISEAHEVCNYPGFNKISGLELSMKMLEHAKENEAELKNETVKSINKVEEGFGITTNNGDYTAKKLILALGRKKQKLNIPGEEKFFGNGVSYCATCDGRFFKDKVVAVVGGSNSALTAAILLASYAEKVYIIYRKDRFFRADPAWVRIADKNKKIHNMFNREIKEIRGRDTVENVSLDDGSTLDVDGVFIEIGSVPDEKFPGQLGIETANGYIKVDNHQKTSVKGVFAAGDITNNPLKQAITACGEGAVAATTAYEELKKEEGEK